MQKAKKIVVVLLSLVFILSLSLAAYLYWGSYGDGYRVGTLLKLSRKGVVFKTWEGELSQGFLEQNQIDGGVATRIWYFTVPRSETEALRALEDALARGERVKLHYREKYYIYPWLGDTRHMVYQVDKVQEPGQSAIQHQ